MNLAHLERLCDDIDELVDEQMAGGEPRIGFDFDDPTYPDCPHCGRKWHGLRLTQDIARMYRYGHFDPDYTVAGDTSPVVCEGSDFIGPQRPLAQPAAGPIWRPPNDPFDTVRYSGMGFGATFASVDEVISVTLQWAGDRIAELLGLPPLSVTLWDAVRNPITPEPCTGELPEVEVTFGPENWTPITEPVQVAPMLERTVGRHWNDFRAEGFPVPASPGFDFSEFATDVQHGPKLSGRRFR